MERGRGGREGGDREGEREAGREGGARAKPDNQPVSSNINAREPWGEETKRNLSY